MSSTGPEGCAAKVSSAAPKPPASFASCSSAARKKNDAIRAKAQAADDEQKKAQQNQLAALDAQIALLGKRKELESARAPVRDPLDKEKELLQKQIDVETLRQQYDALKKKSVASQ